MSRLSLLVLGAFAALLFAVLLPILIDRSPERTGGDATAAPSDVLTIARPVVLSNWPRVVLERGVLRADQVRGASTRQRLVLDQAVLLATVDPALATADEPARASEIDLIRPLTEVLAGLGFEQLTIRRGEVRVRWPGGDGAEREVVLGNVEADLSTRKRGLLTAQGDVAIDGERVVFDAALGPLALGVDRMVKARRPLRVSFKSARAEGDFDGRLDWADTPRLVGQLDATAPSGFELASALGADVGGDRPYLRGVSLKGVLTVADGTLSLDHAQIGFDGQPAGTGTMSWRMRNGRPSMEATLAFERIDMQPYLAGHPDSQGAPLPWSRWPLALPVARGLDADVRVSSTAVFLGEQRLGRGAAALSLKGGRAEIDVAELEIGGHHVRAHFGTDGGDTPRHGLRATLTTPDVAAWLAPMGLGALLSGKASVQVDLRSSGHAVWEALAEATGRVMVTGSGPVRTVLDLRALRTSATATKETAPEARRAAPGLVAEAPVTADVLDLRLVLQPGRLLVDHAYVRQGTLSTTLAGMFTVETGRVDLRASQRTLRPGEKPPTSERRRADPEAAGYLISGEWPKPTISELDANSPRP